MIKLVDILYEINFSDGKDQDRHYSNIVAVFDVNDTYDIDGNTHGLISHAIKHYQDINPSEMKTNIDNVVDIIQNNNPIFKGSNNRIIDNLPTNVRMASIAINTMDFVNDKYMTGESLSVVEVKILNIIQSMANKFESAIEKLINSAIGVDNITSVSSLKNIINTNSQIYFSGKYHSTDIIYYINLKTGFITFKLLNNEKIPSAFVIDKFSESPKQALKKYFSSSSKHINNTIIYNFLIS